MNTALEELLAYSEVHRNRVLMASILFAGVVVWLDWRVLHNVSVGFLYIVPLMLISSLVSGPMVIAAAAACAVLREIFSPAAWSSGAPWRIFAAFLSFSMAAYFVAELSRKRRQIAAAEQQLRAIVQTSPLAILTLKTSGEVLLANDSANRLFGTELGGRYFPSFVPVLGYVLKTHGAAGEIRTSLECKAHRDDGELFLAHVWFSIFDSGVDRRMAAVIWDGSEQLRDQEDAGLNSMMAASRVLIGAISHEVRNLTAAASTAWKQLQGREMGGAAFVTLGAILDGLTAISCTGLNMASNPNVEAADILAVLDELRIVTESRLKEAGIEVSFIVAPDLPKVQANQHSLLQVFLNLVRNSETAMENREEKVLAIEASLSSDVVVVRFSDTGCGVQQPEHLFKPFRSGSKSTGLGLYISRAMLRSHGGEIRYEPALQGSCFRVELWPSEDQR